MQPNEITLPVDVLANNTLVDKLYKRDDAYQNRSVYIGPANSLTKRDWLGLYRTRAKKQGNFNGVAKTSTKFTEDITVPGVDLSTSLNAPLILEINSSIPIGATAAQLTEIRQRAIAYLDSVYAADHMEDLSI